VQVALRAAGIAAPRDTDMMQAELGETVPDGAPLRRGDLVFWKGHVGLLQDAHRLLHANGHHMQVVSEPFAEARQRIAEKSFGDVVAIKRL
jgi:cell wall-associated NlpC family hydrolase